MHLICDFCGCAFIRDYGKWADNAECIHTCSYRCSNSHPRKLEKEKLTNLEKYGVEYPSQLQRIKDKQAQTCLERYGVKSCWRREDVIERARSEDSKMKRHKSLLRNGTFGRSKLESDLASILSAHFEIECNVWLQPKFSIDISIENGKTLIQFDGVHWHGMDLSPDSPDTKHYRIIRSKILTDNDLESQVEAQGKRLIRVTDKFFIKDRVSSCELICSLVRDTSWSGIRRLGKHFSHLNKEAHYVE